MQERDFVVGQFYRTHGNEKVKLIAKSFHIMYGHYQMVFERTTGDLYLTKGNGQELISGITHFNSGNSMGFGGGGGFNRYDIKCKWVEPTTVSGWVCIYADGRIGTTMYPTLEEAQRNKNSHIIDRIYVEGKSK